MPMPQRPGPPPGAGITNKPLPPPPPIGSWQPTTPRQRLRIVLLAIATSLLIWALLLFRPGFKVRQLPPDPPLPVCQPGQTSRCVGGTATVQLLPAAPAASATDAPAASAASR